MLRTRTNDPSNLPASPNPTTDPDRLDELTEEFKKRLKYLTENYAACREFIATGDTFNESLERLRRALKRKRILKSKGTRIHPEIEFLLSHQAQRLAETEGLVVNESHIRAAGEYVVATIKSRRGRPRNSILEHHVATLIALVQEFSGKPVLSQKNTNSVYAPSFPEGISQIIPNIVQLWDKEITTTQLVNMVRKIRKQYAGKPLRFYDLFPTYGVTLENDGLKPQTGTSIEIINVNIRIYCP